MTSVRYLVPALVGGLLWAASLGAQEPTGAISGRVVDGTTQQPVSGANVMIVGTARAVTTDNDGSFAFSGVGAGTHTLRTIRIGYGPQQQEVTVAAGGTATAQFALQPQAALLEAVVVTGYGTQRREAITGSVATVDADAANVGVVTNVNNMIQGRVAGLTATLNSGEPGAGAQIRIRGGTSISASNEPLYVIDGVPISNVETEPSGFTFDRTPSLPRSPLNLINPSDISSISILKDAAAAIYGSRAANGVILIETRKGRPGTASMEYDGYVTIATPARYLNVLNGAEYRQFVQQQVQLGNLTPDRLDGLGTANTDWERELTRTAVTHNHNLAFTGGTEATRYRASLNYMNQEGVVMSSAFERVQGRLNATHHALDDRLRLGLNVTAAHTSNDYLPYENTGGFEGGVFQNMVVFNPTQAVRVTDPATGQVSFYELGTGRQSVRNPVALADQIADFGNTTRTLGNVTADLDLVAGLTARVNVGADRSEGTRQIYLPRESPVGAEWEGRAEQKSRENSAVTLQTVLTFRRQFDVHGLDVVGGYEFSKFKTEEFGAEARAFPADAFSFDNLGGGNVLVRPFSFRQDSRFVAFFSRANYSFRDRYFLTGILRYDGASRFGAGHKWALFPAVSGSWRISEEEFMRNAPLSISDLRLRVGYGLQGNPAVPPYESLLLLEPSGDARYVFGEQTVTGVAPVQNPNPDLKWEQTSQFNVALDYGFLNNRLSGTVEYYVKNTKDLLLRVTVPQPAIERERLENIGKVRNRGLEISLDALPLVRPNGSWRAGLVFALERNEVIDLGGRSFITTGDVSGQGQSGQVAQRVMPGHPLGTFFGPVFVGVDEQGKQLFRCSTGASCVDGKTTSPTADDYAVIGDANPDFTLGLHSQVTWGKVDASFLIRAEVGKDVFNNAALVYSTKGNALQDKNFLEAALNDPTGIREPAIFSSRWIEDGSFVRLQNLTVGYTVELPRFIGGARSARVYVSGDNLILVTDYTGYDPEVHVEAPLGGVAARGMDYLTYPRARTVTAGIRLAF